MQLLTLPEGSMYGLTLFLCLLSAVDMKACSLTTAVCLPWHKASLFRAS